MAQQVVATLAPRTVLAKRYRIEQPIGSGGYASVYRATDMRFDTECAIKEVVDPDPAVRKQFQLEADLLIRAPHQNIPKGYDLIDERGRMFLVMEYIRGKDLEELLNDSLVNRGRALDEPQVLRWMIQICDALIAMHNQPVPIIHRDIKPANIKITPDGRPVLIDFGLAKQQRAGNPTMTAAQGVSPGFAPPEQYMAKGRTDARTDVYALGATLYACLTGKDPAEAPARLLAQTGARGNGGATLKPARALNPRVSEATDRIITKALELSPMQRQQAARTLQTELKHSLAALTGATSGTMRAVQTCARCGAANRPDAGECASCGALLPGGSSPSAKRAAAAKNGSSAGSRAPKAGIAAAAATGAYAALSADSPSSKQSAAGANGRTGKQPAAGGVGGAAGARRKVKDAANAVPDPRTAKHVAAAADSPTAQQAAVGRTGKQAAAVAGQPTRQQPAVAMPGTTRQPVVAPRIDFTPTPGFAAAHGGSMAFAGALPATAVGVASHGAVDARGRTTGSRPWIKLGGGRLGAFGKWVLALSCIEVLWGATVLALGGMVIAMPGQSLPLQQFGVIWAVVVILLSLIGGQALSRPVFRRDAQTKLRRGLQGTGLLLYTLVVHGVAVWGASIFASTQGNATLATVAFLLFGVNVLVVGILSVVNVLS